MPKRPAFVLMGETIGDVKFAVTLILFPPYANAQSKSRDRWVAASHGFRIKLKFPGSLLQIVQMSLVRRARYCAPIAEGKREAAGAGCHPVL
jgi:hypothetical protein